MPEAFAGGSVESYERITEQASAFAIATVVVGPGRSQGQEYYAALGIDTQDGPGVHGGAVLPGIALPGIISELALLRDGVEYPDLLAGAGVECADIALRTLWLAIGGQRSADYQVLIYGRRRGHPVTTVRKLVRHTDLKIDES